MKTIVRKTAALTALLLLVCGQAAAADSPEIKIYKSPTCGCCVKWADQLAASGFIVETINVSNVVPIKQQQQVPRQLGSCHTAVTEGYVIEGHVPIADILRLLKDKPDVRGIAVPGMPIGSPGMEGPNPQPFKVYSFDDTGEIREFASHSP